MSDHAVIINFDYGKRDLSAYFEARDKLRAVIDKAQVGEFEGNEIAVDRSDGSFFMCGPDADSLFNAIKATLKEIPFMAGATVTKLYGPPEDGVREEVITLDA